MRFLCLHGMGTNAQIFEAQLSSIRNELVGNHEFIFAEGEVECDPAPGIENFYPGPYKCYYDLPTAAGVEEAFEYLNDIIEDEGPFDGVIGFSQGGALASAFILQDSKQDHPTIPFKCAVLFCASMPFDIDSEAFTYSSDGICRLVSTGEPIKHFDIKNVIPEATTAGYSGMHSEEAEYLRRYIPSVEEKAFIHLPTTHIIGATDGYNSQSSNLRKLCCPNNMQFMEHRGGHEIPKDRNTTTNITNKIQRMLHAVLVG